MADVVEPLSTESLSADEISDAVWLAARIAAAGPRQRTSEPAPRSVPPKPSPSQPHESSAPFPASDWNEESSHAPAGMVSTRLELAPSNERLPTVAMPANRGRSIAPELPEGLAKALLQLNRLIPSTRHSELDEEQTAVAAAESGMWLPVDRPIREHPFELVLVIDRGESMRIWDRTAAAFRLVLERQGAFTDVRTVSVNTDEKTIRSVETVPGTSFPPAMLADPTRRRIVLIFTDGVGPAWRSGSMLDLASRWARTCHVALTHVLPADRWNWTGIRVQPAIIPSAPPGTTNTIPVLALDKRYLRRWAELISGTADVRLPVLMPPYKDDIGEAVPDKVLPAAERLRRFRATATPQAVRLTQLLACAPLNLRVIQAVRNHMLPESEPWHLAEVLLGGLLRRVPATAGQSIVEYDFGPGIRRNLLATMIRDDTAHVLRVVADVLGPGEPAISDLREVLAAPDDVELPAVTPRTEPLLVVQHEVLAALAGPYTRRAKRLGEALDAYDTPHGKTDTTANSDDMALTRPVNLGAEAEHGDEITFGASDVSSGTIQSHLGISSVTMTSSEPGTDVGRSDRKPTVWGGVPLRNINFIGRTEPLASLHAKLSRSTTTAVLPGALHGMGGIGKSQIAVEFVYRHATEYDLIWWIPSENLSEIQRCLVELAQRLKLPVERSVDTAVPAVLEALSVGEPYRRWLLVFDNADHLEDVRKFWPRRGEGHILVTSRNPQWSEVAQAVEVNVFQRAESRELLQRRNIDLADEDADRLAITLGDLPLAIEQAAAWRAETGMRTGDYLELLHEKRTELLESRPPADYDVTVEAAWNVSLDRLREENPGALELLFVCSFFSPEPIPQGIFRKVRDMPVSPELQRIFDEPIQLGRAVREITRFSLAKIDHRSDTLVLHRLVQLVLRNKLSPDEQETVRHTAHLLLANRDPEEPDAVGSWPRYAELLSHIRAVDARDCTDSWVRRMTINTVNYLFAFGDPSGALSMARELAEFWGEKLVPKHADTLIASRWWGRMLRALGQFEAGREIAERTLDTMRETLGDTHEETLLTIHGVASDLRAKGDFQKAREMNEFAYRSAVDSFRRDHPDTLAAANNYALSLRLVGEFTAARDLDEKTWQLKKEVLGEDHRHTLLTLDNWSVDLRETGDYLRARAEQEETVRRMRTLLGDRHPMTLSAIKNLAIACRKAGHHQNQKALRLAQEATQGLVNKYGESHPDAMSAAMDLSIEHRQEGNLSEARRLGEHVKYLYETTWGLKHPFSVAAATNLAVTLRLLEQVGQARELNEQALADMHDALGADHPFTLVCATNYASDLAASGEYEAAYAFDQETFERSVQVLGELHPSSLALLVNQALDLRGLERINEADKLQQRAVEKLRRVLGLTHPATNDAQFNHRANCDIDPMQI